MSEYGPNAWRLYNKTLKTMFDQAEVQLEEIKKQIQNVNLTRKNEQMVAGNKLRSLEQSWIGLVSKNYEIECAIVELEKELIELKKKKMASDANSKQIEESSDVPESTENADQN